MKVLLVCPILEKYMEPPAVPLGLLSISTHILKKNHQVKIEDRSTDVRKIEKVIKDFNPDIIGLSVYSSKSIRDALKVSKIANKNNIKVVWGGPLPSAIPEVVLQEESVDFVCIGEGEFVFAELLEALENNKPLDEVYGIAYKKNGLFTIHPERDFSDPAEWPIIDWSLIDISKYTHSHHDCRNMTWVYSAKGCPNNCSFCYNKQFHKCRYRKRPLENVVMEIKDLVKNYKVDGVYFADEIWFLSRNEMKEKCDRIRDVGLDFVWGCLLKVGILEKEDYDYMYNSGCRWICFGIESGSQRILKNINKGIDIDQIEKTAINCTEAGIAVWTSFILGFPGETEEDIKQTVNLIKSLSPYAIFLCFFFTPTLGSELYEKLVRDGELRPFDRLTMFKEYSFDVVGTNFSKVPTRDLKVVNAYVLWWSFTNTIHSSESSKHAFSFQVISHIFSNFKKGGLKYLVTGVVFPAYKFFGYLFNMTFFPTIRKKYGLSFKPSTNKQT